MRVTMMLMTITRQMMLFSFLTFSHLPRGAVPCQPYFLTLCPLLEIIWLEENGVKFVRFGRHTTFSLAPGKLQYWGENVTKPAHCLQVCWSWAILFHPSLCNFFALKPSFAFSRDRQKVQGGKLLPTQCHDRRRTKSWNGLFRTSARITYCGWTNIVLWEGAESHAVEQMETVKFNLKDGVGLQTTSGRWSVENGTKSDKSRFVVGICGTGWG